MEIRYDICALDGFGRDKIDYRVTGMNEYNLQFRSIAPAQGEFKPISFISNSNGSMGSFHF